MHGRHIATALLGPATLALGVIWTAELAGAGWIRPWEGERCQHADLDGRRADKG